jgi:hypothetical protein
MFPFTACWGGDSTTHSVDLTIPERSARAQGSLDPQAGDGPGDHDLLDLARSLEDGVNLRDDDHLTCSECYGKLQLCRSVPAECPSRPGRGRFQPVRAAWILASVRRVGTDGG